MDATGVGAPVLDLLRQANLGCGIVPVNLTGGDLVSQSGSLWNVPKQVLISGLLVMLEKKELALSMRVPSARVSRSGHLSFGTWRARWRSEGIWGTKSLGLEY
jgi:hypothetical protein